jgi:hypothetical protein
MKRAAGVLALTLAAAAPAAAPAATLAVSPAKACYISGERVTLSGTGFTPGALANVALDGAAVGPVPVDTTGNFRTGFRFGSLRGVRARTLTATDSASPANVGSASFLGSVLSVRVWPADGRPGRRLRIRATGFTSGRRLWAHILRPGFRRNVRIGRLRGPCGRASVRRRIFMGDAAPGRYKVQFDTRRRYSPRTRVRVRFRVTVSGTPPVASTATPAWRPID